MILEDIAQQLSQKLSVALKRDVSVAIVDNDLISYRFAVIGERDGRNFNSSHYDFCENPLAWWNATQIDKLAESFRIGIETENFYSKKRILVADRLGNQTNAPFEFNGLDDLIFTGHESEVEMKDQDKIRALSNGEEMILGTSHYGYGVGDIVADGKGTRWKVIEFKMGGVVLEPDNEQANKLYGRIYDPNMSYYHKV